MFFETIAVGPFQCNCMILACERTKEAVIIDPGDEAGRILDLVRANGLAVKAMLHTHAHLDHVGASSLLRAELEAPILLHKEDLWLYERLPMQGALFGLKYEAPHAVDRWLEDGMKLDFGEHGLSVLHTPGHTPGSVCFRMEAEKHLVFTGDTLFAGSVGRTDLWGGSHPQLIRSIKERLLTLPEDTIVWPGHGPRTRMGYEKSHNPFLV